MIDPVRWPAEACSPYPGNCTSWTPPRRDRVGKETDMSSKKMLRASAAAAWLAGTTGPGLAAPPCAAFALTGNAHPTARSGFAGKAVPLGDANSGDRALWGLSSKET